MTTALMNVAVLLYGVLAPGFGLATALFGGRPMVEKVAIGGVLSLFVVPLLHFVVAIGLGTHVSVALVCADATVVLALAWWLGRHVAQRKGPGEDAKGSER